MRSQFLMLVCAVSAVLSGTALFTAIHNQPGLWLHVIFITSVAVLFWQILGKLRYAGMRSIRQAAKHAHRDPDHQSNPENQERRAIG